MSFRGSFGGFYFVIASYGKIKSSENDRKIAVSAQKAPKVRLMENLGLSKNQDRERQSTSSQCTKKKGASKDAPPKNFHVLAV
jgi:hypothetical protein